MRHLQFTAAVPTVYGTMLVNRNDLSQMPPLFRGRVAIDHDEIALLAHLLRHCDPNPIVVDVGANIGTYTIGLASVIEPETDSRAVVRFHNKRGMAEQRIKGKQALKMARLIQHVFGPSPPVDRPFHLTLLSGPSRAGEITRTIVHTWITNSRKPRNGRDPYFWDSITRSAGV